MSRRLVIIGAGDHARVLADIARSTGWERVAFVEPGSTEAATGPREPGTLTVDGDLDRPEAWVQVQDGFSVALGDNGRRAEAWKRCLALGLRPTTLIHPSAILLGGCEVGEGAQVCAAAVIGVDARVAGNAIVNTGASIDHDVRVAEHAQIGPGSHLAGRVRVGEGAFIGTGAAIIPGMTIGAWATVGAGAAVIGDVPAGARVGGVPARPLGDASG